MADRQRDGSISLWAPVNGSTTPHSSHARTELVSLTPFPAGTGRHVLTASVVVTQVPREKPDVIVGQIHGADAQSAVPFVMLHYQDAAIVVAVKQNREGPAAARYPLLTGVPLGAPFGFTIADNGDGSLAFTASRDGETGRATAPVPAPFRGGPVRFQTGAYQQADTNQAAAPDDGGRVTFRALTVAP